MDNSVLGKRWTPPGTESKTVCSQKNPFTHSKRQAETGAASIRMSKIRHGLQLTNKFRLTEEDRKLKNIKAVQLAPKKLL